VVLQRLNEEEKAARVPVEAREEVSAGPVGAREERKSNVNVVVTKRNVIRAEGRNANEQGQDARVEAAEVKLSMMVKHQSNRS